MYIALLEITNRYALIECLPETAQHIDIKMKRKDSDSVTYAYNFSHLEDYTNTG